jgi:hypothetical protein
MLRMFIQTAENNKLVRQFIAWWTSAKTVTRVANIIPSWVLTIKALKFQVQNQQEVKTWTASQETFSFWKSLSLYIHIYI